ncbi:MAG: DUF1036 domain-containing protein [bacterium]
MAIRIFIPLILGFFVLTGVARAEYSLCNKTSYAMSAAIGYVDEGRMITRGWWRLRAGECKVVITDAIAPGLYFIYSEAIAGHRGPLRSWSGDRPLCVENESLFTLYDQDVCATDPRRQRDFIAVEVPDESNGSWRSEFVEEKNYDVYTAEKAGVQRLLKDVGYDIKSIDGTIGPTTQRVLRKYRKDRGLGEAGIYDDEMIDQLIIEANKRDAKLGFFFCNSTNLPIWAALGEPSTEDGYRSSGWWRLEGSECTKVIRGELTANHYYVYGVMDLGDKDLSLTGGTLKMCISNVQFDSAGDVNCAEAGYEEAAFRRVEVGGEKTWTYKFTPDQFNAEIAASDAKGSE